MSEKVSLVSRLLESSSRKERSVRLTVDIPGSMHRKLSILCAKTGKKKVDIVRMLLDEALQEVPEYSEPQKKDAENHPWLFVIQEYIGRREVVTISQVLDECLHIDPSIQEKRHQMLVSEILKHLGWTRDTRRIDGRPSKVWVNPDPPTSILTDGESKVEALEDEVKLLRSLLGGSESGSPYSGLTAPTEDEMKRLFTLLAQ